MPYRFTTYALRRTACPVSSALQGKADIALFKDGVASARQITDVHRRFDGLEHDLLEVRELIRSRDADSRVDSIDRTAKELKVPPHTPTVITTLSPPLCMFAMKMCECVRSHGGK
jgi:hypothetical protein